MTSLRFTALLAFLIASTQAAPPTVEKSVPTAVPVRLEQTPKGWRMLRDGSPYFVKGACVWGENVRLSDLKDAGANSLRTYHSKYARWTLDAAQRRGMTVMLGYEISGHHEGFSYLDPGDVKRQRERYLEFVRKYKNHPALLVWAIGNEVEQNVQPEFAEAMWKELNELARLTKEIDPNHPTAIVLAGAPDEKLQAVREWCPDVDLICINSYKGLRDLPEHLAKNDWKKPYLITEFGAVGWWEAPVTEWGAPIEMTSTEKAKEYLTAYQRGILRDRQHCLGSYVFFWEPKQEATSTWFGLFLSGGERLEMIDVMTQAWSGRKPRNRSPQITTLEFAGGKDHYFPGDLVEVKLAASDPGRDPMGVSWRIMEESPPFTPENGYQSVPRALLEHSIMPLDDGAQFPAPAKPGAYRIFVFVYDGNGNAATGNLCFFVDAIAPAPSPTPTPAPPVPQPEGEPTPP